jgi:hypothetical protein
MDWFRLPHGPHVSQSYHPPVRQRPLPHRHHRSPDGPRYEADGFLLECARRPLARSRIIRIPERARYQDHAKSPRLHWLCLLLSSHHGRPSLRLL